MKKIVIFFGRNYNFYKLKLDLWFLIFELDMFKI